MEFILYMMPDYIVNWHHEAICERLTRLKDEEGKKIMIFVGPQRGKSLIVSRMFTAWWLGHFPGSKNVLASYSGDLANSFNRDTQSILAQAEYADVFPDLKTGQHDARIKMTQNELHTSENGYLLSVGAGGGTTGKSAGAMGSKGENVQKGCFICDDPIKDRSTVQSKTQMNTLMNWWRDVVKTRTHRTSHTILMHTRWGQNDLAGNLIAEGAAQSGWEIISFPEVGSDPEYKNKWDDRKPGEKSCEVLWEEEKGDYKELMELKKDVGSYTWASLYQQKPKADGGNIIQEDWIQFYSSLPFDPARVRSSEIVQSWDLQFKATGTSWTVGITLVKCLADYYLVDIYRKKADIIETKRAIKAMANRYPNCHQILIEKAANGEAILSLLKKEVSGMIGIKATASKDERVHVISPIFESGNFYLPANHPMTPTIVDELTSFPAGFSDDICDAISQALTRFGKKRGLAHLKAMTS